MRSFGPRTLLLLALLAGPVLWAGPAAGATRVTHEQGVYEVEARFNIDRGQEEVWEVLTDYSDFPRFVRSVKRSVVRARRTDRVLVEQVADAKALIFRRTLRVLLEVREQDGRRIEFRDLSRRDFELYEGSWTLVPHGGSVQVIYRLRAKPRQSLPAVLGVDAIKANTQALLGDVRDEMHRRAPSPGTRKDVR